MNEANKRRILVLLVAISVLPAFALLPFPALISLSSVSLWVADSLGYVGIVLLLWMYILGAKSVMSLVFTDLAPVLSIHKWLGKYGSLAIFAHPLLVTYSYGESWLYSFIPQLSTQFERHVTLGRLAFFLLLLIWFVSAIIRDRMKFRPWKYLHYLAYICLPFAFLHVPDVGSNYMHQQAVKTYFFGLLIVFLAFSFFRIRGFLNLDKATYIVKEHIHINDTDFVLKLSPVTANVIKPKRGQYVYVKLGIISEDHPFSALQYNPTTNELMVGYRVFGSYTKVLSKLQTGAKVFVGGPFGSFMHDFEHDERPVVFLAGGIGITPFVDQIFHGAGKREQWLFAANRSRETAILIPEVKPYLNDHLVNVYNNETSPLGPNEETGYITPDMLKKYLGEPARYSFYLCGPPPMMHAVRTTLGNLGVPETNIKSEKFGW